jgi:hydroxyacyl-ACP dehydratase HTD2-like protein with hotdog domain
MDGTLADRFINGRRMRLASFDYAVEAFPQLIVHLLQDKLLVDIACQFETKQVITLYSKTGDKSDFFAILKEDFDLCKQIASSISMPLFPTDLNQDYIDRARAMVRVKFAGRP